MRCGWCWVMRGIIRFRWTACQSIVTKIGCSAHTLLDWLKRAEINAGKRAGLPAEMAEKMKALKWENRELPQANEILRKASAYFAQAPFGECQHSPAGQGELDRPFKR